MKFSATSWFKLLFAFSLTVSLLLGRVSITQAELPNPDRLVERGFREYQNRAYQAAIASWQQALASYETENNPNKIVVLENLARVYQQIGQTETAIAFWSQTIENYQQRGNIQQVARSLTEQAQAYSRLGQHRQAIAILCSEFNSYRVEEQQECQAGSAIALAESTEDRQGKTAAWGSLAEAYRLRGNYQVAVQYGEQSLSLAQLENSPGLTMAALQSLGNSYSSLAQISYRRAESAQRRGEIYGKNSLFAKETKNAQTSDRQALAYFQQHLALARTEENSTAIVNNLVSTLPIYYRLQQSDRATVAKQEAISLIPSLPPQQSNIYATIDLAKLLQPERLTYNTCLDADNLKQSRELLQSAVTKAEKLQNNRAKSFALGELGHSYECEGDYSRALNFTDQARFVAERDKDSLYLLDCQTVRIFNRQGDLVKSIAAYEAAIAT
ncbi:MAG: tetratricopeptide repeat protein, partial [Pleurocapsa sp.]